MARDTSIESYNAMEACDFVDKTKLDVYRCLYHYGPLTQNEVWEKLGRPNKKDSYGPRFAVLVRMGVIADLGTRTCTVTGRRCHFYDVTSKMPVKPAASKRTVFWLVMPPGSRFKGEAFRVKAHAEKRLKKLTSLGVTLIEAVSRKTGRLVKPE